MFAENREEAEKQVADEAPNFRILRSREIDMSGIPPLRSGALPKSWVVVIEHEDPDEERKLPQHDNPEGFCEREQRLFFLKMATNPDLLVTGVSESFDCPVCGEKGMASLEAPSERSDPEHTKCEACHAHLHRIVGSREWTKVERESFPDCIFCGEKANSKEHVLPEWISKRLGVKNLLTPVPHLRTSAPPGRQPISFSSFRKRFFCQGCNAHFKHLEDKALELLVPMAKGHNVVIGDDAKGLISLWAAKTSVAITTAIADDPEIVPQADRRAIRHESRVPDDYWIGIFNNPGNPMLAVDGQTERDPGSREQIPFRTVLAFRRLGFGVAGRGGEIPDWQIPIQGKGQIHQVWPVRPDQLIWPS